MAGLISNVNHSRARGSFVSHEQHDVQPQLGKLLHQINGVSGLAQRLVGGLYSEQLRLQPEPGKWSIAECLVHLSLTAAAFVPIVNKACEDARQQQILGNGPYKMDAAGRLLKWTMKPPPRLRVRTVDGFLPTIIEPIDQVLPQFLSSQSAIEQTVVSAAGIDLNRVKVASPFSKRVRYNLYSCFELIVTHQLRHLWQAEQVKREILRER
jgi:DinB superfamily